MGCDVVFFAQKATSFNQRALTNDRKSWLDLVLTQFSGDSLMVRQLENGPELANCR